MAGIRIRWRRASSGLAPATAAGRPAEAASGRAGLDAFVWLAAGAIVLFALAARLYNVGWDDDAHLHPDERHLTLVATQVELPGGVGEYFDSDGSPLNPYSSPQAGSFVYGTLPLFLTKATAVAVGRDDYNGLAIVGRYLSALFAGATVLFVFLAGRRLYGPAAGLAGAILMASAPLAIQQAHFFVVDPFLAFFTTAVLYFSVRAAQEGRRADYLLAGLALGLGAACKVTALLVTPAIVLAAVAHAWPALSFVARAPLAKTSRTGLAGPALGLALAGAVAFLAFRVAQPYAFDPPRLANLGVGLSERWLDDQRAQTKLLSGEAAFPPSVQWIGRESYLYPLQEMVLWGMGPAFGVAGWLAVVYAAYRLVRLREARHLLPLAFVLVYFGFMGRQFSLYLRYFLPLYPVLAVLAGYALVEAVRGGGALAARLRRPELAALGYGAAGAVLVLSALAGLAYLSVYSRPVTRVEANAWVFTHVPPGRTIAVEHWDDRVPGYADDRYRFVELAMYETDTPAKVKNLLDGLTAADYVVMSSNRLLSSIPRNQVSYPVSARYYELLLQGRLGFRLLHSFESYPGLLGLDFPDGDAEESWSSYDHPRVLIFQKTGEFSRAELETLLGQGPFGTALTPAQADRNGLMLSAGDLATQREGGTWSSVFSEGGFADSNPTLLWLLVLEAAALAVTPLTLAVCRRLPDRGYLLAKPLGVLLLAYPVWLLASLKVVHFDQTAILGSLLALAVVGGAVAWWSRADLAGFLRANWRLVLVCELLFLAAFFLLRELRMANPDLWHPARGGEKPMDLAYLTAVTRSTTLPPYDPWFAGGYINYYYLGHFLTATLAKLTAIRPEVAFNLAVPTFFALTVAGAFSVSFSLAAAARAYLRRRPGFRPIAGWSPYAAGLLGVFFVAVAGNLDGADQLAERLSAVSTWHLSTPVPLLDAVVNSIGGAWQVVVNGADLQRFDYWRSSRMLPPTISITEFPYFSFLFADLHAHMMAIPFEVLAVGLSLALLLGGRQEGGWRRWTMVGGLGLVVGGLRWLNSWDYPPFLLVALAALAIGVLPGKEAGGWPAAARRFLVGGGVLVGLSFLLYLPFLETYVTPVSGLHAAPERTPLHQYLAHFGVFAAPIGAWLLYLLLRALRVSPFARVSRPLAPADRDWLASALLLAGAVALAGGGLLIDGRGFVAALLPVLVVVGYLAARELRLRRPDGGLRLFLLVLVGLGLGLSAGVDVVTLDGDIQRMNTVFKFYLHTWVVFAIVAAFAAWQLVFVLWPPVMAAARLLPRLVVASGTMALGALVLAAAVYPLAATPARLDDRFRGLPRTLDGTAYMQSALYRDEKGTIDLSVDYEGIQWLRRNVEGTPAIVEGRTPLYRWGGRFSIYTGLPAVLGWDWHQQQQRGELAFMVDQRAKQVDDFYASTDVAQAVRFLRQYGVEYVIVGQVERRYYPAAGLRKFEAGLGGSIEVAYTYETLTIYRVLPEPRQLSANASP